MLNRRYCLFLLFLSSFIPLNIAYLYYDHYSGIELKLRKHFSNADDESLLTQFQKNPRVFYSPMLSLKSHLLSLLEISFLFYNEVRLRHPQNLVLRC